MTTDFVRILKQEDDDKFAAHGVQTVTPACDTCLHRSKVNAGICTAFPNGIPTKILMGMDDHKKAFPGDHGVRYQKVAS